ncbi:3-dehydroquinate synthase [uncultured archaeon]|nr:3-dehydroquinate synthase [uncultured archaeon]
MIVSSKLSEVEIDKGIFKQVLDLDGFFMVDENVLKNFPELSKKNLFVVISGEESKSLENYKSALEALDKSGKKTIIAVGGGVTGDLAGFVASTYKRGVELFQVPTTLLAMIDSSLGGKNGINLGSKKNYVGTIYQPKKIIVDPNFLKTLSKKEISNGLAEAIKYFSVFGEPSFFELFNFDINNSQNVISNCCKIKLAIVEEDERDIGIRHTLNFGHTVGHALERVYNLSHGEAISIGMIKELVLAKKLNLVTEEKINQIKKLLEKNSLPTEFPPNFNLKNCLDMMELDKKGSLVFSFDKKNFNVKLTRDFLEENLK